MSKATLELLEEMKTTKEEKYGCADTVKIGNILYITKIYEEDKG